MTKLTIDNPLQQLLRRFDGCVELCDEGGQTIGFFTPATAGPLQPKVSDEELQRRENETETFTTKQVKEYLENL